MKNIKFKVYKDKKIDIIEGSSFKSIIIKDKDEIIKMKQALIESQNQVINRLELLLSLLSDKIATQEQLDYEQIKRVIKKNEGDEKNGQN